MRSLIALTSALLMLSIAAFGADAKTLTSKNSVVTPFPFAEIVEARSPDCVTPGVGVIPLPADTLSMKLASPKLGAKLQGARVTAIDAAAPGFTITFNAEPDLCDPLINGLEPGTAVPWSVYVTATGTFDRRVAACLRPYFDVYSSVKCKARPRKVYTGIEGIERGFRQYYYGIRWKSFG